MTLLSRIVDKIYGNPSLLADDPCFDKIKRLYENAKRDQWNASHLFDEDLSQKEINNLNPEEKSALARILSQFYYGERGALLVSSQLIAEIKDLSADNFLATQCVDEARHMEIFQRLTQLCGGLQPINPFLELLLSDIMASSGIEKLVGMNLLVEGLALSSFQYMVKTWRSHPKMSGNHVIMDPIEAVIRDESRHVGFGVLYVAKQLPSMSYFAKTRLKIRQAAWFALLYGSVRYHKKDTALLGLDFQSVYDTVIQDHKERWREIYESR